MASDILKNIIEQKIDIFANTFGEGASNIFRRDEKIFHPLEYGMYKERCAKELLSFTTNRNIGISDGFLITANNNVSTQCDIVMYAKDTLPMIDNGITNFYPIEIVKGIGEIKSTLSRADFVKALLKLAKNKAMFEERKGTLKTDEGMFEEDKEIFTFLICNKLEFDINKVDFDEIYRDIPDIKYRHNIMLSLQDGLFTYKLNFTDLHKKQMEHFLRKGGNIKAGSIIWNYPHHTEIDECYKCDNCLIQIDYKNKYMHIMHFLIIVKSLLDQVCEYDFDLVNYLLPSRKSIFG